MKTALILFWLPLLTVFTLCAQGTYTMADTVLAKRYMEEAKVLIDSARYDAALEKLDLAEAIWEGTVGKETVQYAEIAHQKGRCFVRLIDYEKAMFFFQKALEIRLLFFNTEDINIADSYYAIGFVLSQRGDYNQAISYYQKSIEIRINNLGVENLSVANAYGNLGIIYDDIGDYNLAIACHQKSLEIRLKIIGTSHPDIADNYNNLGVVYQSKGEYEKAIEYYNKGLEIRLNRLKAGHVDIASSYFNLGNVYYIKSDYNRAGYFHQEALKILINVYGLNHTEVATSFNSIGAIYFDKGDYEKALDYFQKALQIQLENLHPKHPYVADGYNNIGIVLYAKGNYIYGIECHRKALEVRLDKFGAKHPSVATSYHNLGNIYNGIGDYERAIEYYQKAIDSELSKVGPEHVKLTVHYQGIGNAYYNKGEYAKSIEYHQMALAILSNKFRSNYIVEARSLLSISSASRKLFRFNESESYIKQSLAILHFDNDLNLHRIKSLPLLIESLITKAIFYKSWHAHSFNLRHLHTSRQSFSEALAAITYQRQSLDNPSSKSTLAKTSAGVYEGGISVNHLLYQHTNSLHYLHDAFHYAEQSKALTLYESMKNAEALQIAGIPDSLLQHEYDLRIDIAYHEKRRQELYMEGKEETDTTVLSVSGKIFDLKRAHEALIDTFKTQYPDYYRAKYDLRTEDVPGVQQLLQPGQALLEYFVGDSSVFIFLIKKDDFRVIEVKKDFPLEDWVRRLQYGIYGYRVDSIQHDTLPSFAAKTYTDAAWLLYQKLLAPVDSLLPRRVVIIPDGVLGNVPFEALLRKKPALPHRFHEHDYFCRDRDVSYCYSATLWREMMLKKHRKTPQGTVLAVAPFEKKSYRQVQDLFGNVVLNPSPETEPLLSGAKRHKFDSLPRSGEEVYSIAKLWNGDYWLDADATEARFVGHAGDYRILELATHGKADNRAGDYSYLAFAQIPDSVENELFYVREIYNLSLNADLVVLSACETAAGELQRGEGIISLARAFSYAGAKSIVTTLWTADDRAAKDLMIAFHQNLYAGMDKDEALAQARRWYLATYRGPNASPYYWAGFVAVGDMGAIGAR